MPHVVVVGAGISGLSAAYHLQTQLPQAKVTVLEAAARPGGTVWTERRDGFQVEIGSNGFLDTKASTLQLCSQLGIGDDLIAASDAARHRYLFHCNRLVRLPEGLWSFVRSPLLSWRAKFSLLTERYRPPRPPAGDESLYDFVARRTCPEVAETLADAFATGIYAGDPRMLSLRSAFPRLAAFEQEFGSVTAGIRGAARERRLQVRPAGEPVRLGSRLLSFPAGLRHLIECLCRQLRQPPLLGMSVSRLHRIETGWRLHTEDGQPWDADAVLLAAPAYRQADLLAGFDGELAAVMRSIPYAAAAVVGLGYAVKDMPLGFGFIVPQRLRRDILGVQWCSSIFPDRAPPGHILLRAIAGGWNRPDIADWDEARLVAAVRTELQQTMRVAVPPVLQHVVRWKKAIPQYHLGHHEKVARIETLAARHPGLFVTGNAYRGVALNDCTEQGERVAREIVQYLTEARTAH